jgi:hypothetical protein
MERFPTVSLVKLSSKAQEPCANVPYLPLILSDNGVLDVFYLQFFSYLYTSTRGKHLRVQFSRGIFDIGGNCKIQFPQMKGGCVTLQFHQMKFVLVTLTDCKVVRAGIFLTMTDSKA